MVVHACLCGEYSLHTKNEDQIKSVKFLVELSVFKISLNAPYVQNPKLRILLTATVLSPRSFEIRRSGYFNIIGTNSSILLKHSSILLKMETSGNVRTQTNSNEQLNW